MKIEKTHTCHGGQIHYCTHESAETHTPMRFSIFLPPQAHADTPYLVFLSGLTCSEENFTTKANAYKTAADLGIAILAPDTSPRGDDVPDHDDYDLGQGAGFYIDATHAPWVKNYRMESYIIHELLPLVEERFPLSSERKSISGHSMGGHGALTLYLKYPNMFKSCSAFSPIVAPSQVPWGKKAFNAYLGDNEKEWHKHDACTLLQTHPLPDTHILIDQGLADNFLDEQLKPHLLEDAAKKSGHTITLRMHDGYDHSYFFIQSFIAEHLNWHAQFLSD